MQRLRLWVICGVVGLLLGTGGNVATRAAPPESGPAAPDSTAATPDSTAAAPDSITAPAAASTRRAPVLETPAAADTVPAGSLRERLQRQDEARYDAELLQPDSTFRDSALAVFDSLGLDQARSKQRIALDLGFNLAPQLWNYNRVEGLVLGAGVDLGPKHSDEPWIEFQGGYAFGTEKFRHYEALRLPLAPHAWGLAARVDFGERVVPYGSNRPLWNSVRAFVGGEDARDYLESRGGSAFVQWKKYRSVQLGIGYEAAEEKSAAATTSFALFGDMAPVNDAIQDGTDRAVVGTLRLGSLERYMARLDAEHRVAGGDLGGDFTYNRTELQLALRRYFGRQECILRARYDRVGGDAPVQRLPDAGGVSSVRGFKKRAQVGQSALAARLESPLPYDFFGKSGIPILWRLRLQFVPWGDAARTWDGPTDAWIYSAGLGVQHYLGPFGDPTFLRFDVAFPMGPDRSRDVRLELHFMTGVF